jgi:hypothetical protein
MNERKKEKRLDSIVFIFRLYVVDKFNCNNAATTAAEVTVKIKRES